jgi:hypothetical protein
VLCLYFIRYSVSRNSAVFGVPDQGKARFRFSFEFRVSASLFGRSDSASLHAPSTARTRLDRRGCRRARPGSESIIEDRSPFRSDSIECRHTLRGRQVRTRIDHHQGDPGLDRPCAGGFSRPSTHADPTPGHTITSAVVRHEPSCPDHVESKPRLGYRMGEGPTPYRRSAPLPSFDGPVAVAVSPSERRHRHCACPCAARRTAPGARRPRSASPRRR